MKILITGSLGLVGSEAMSFFKALGHEVFGIDNNMRSELFGVSESLLGPEEACIDIRKEDQVNSLFKNYKFDAIVHTAAQPSHDWSKKDPLTDFDINARGTLILLEATRHYCPEAVFVHVSTDKVYGENMDGHFWESPTRFNYGKEHNEDMSIDRARRSPFGCSKTAADIYVQEYGYYFGLKTACFRCGCITGRAHKGAEEHGFLAYLSKCIKEGKEYTVFGHKGKQVRDIIHAYDLVSAMWAFIQNPKIAEVYNMGGGDDRSVSILEAIKMIEKGSGKTAITKYEENARLGDRAWDIHDVSKFRKHFPDWEYKFSLQDIIKELCE